MELNKTLDKVFFIRLFHTIVFFYMCACLLYILYAGLSRDFSWLLLVALISIFTEGLALLMNQGHCPLTSLAEKYGAINGSVTDMFLPAVIAKNTFKFSMVLFLLELILLGIRYIGEI